jgi:hypothetical protein
VSGKIETVSGNVYRGLSRIGMNILNFKSLSPVETAIIRLTAVQCSVTALL